MITNFLASPRDQLLTTTEKPVMAKIGYFFQKVPKYFFDKNLVTL
jgi:hypothetical protein